MVWYYSNRDQQCRLVFTRVLLASFFFETAVPSVPVVCDRKKKYNNVFSVHFCRISQKQDNELNFAVAVVVTSSAPLPRPRYCYRQSQTAAAAPSPSAAYAGEHSTSFVQV